MTAASGQGPLKSLVVHVDHGPRTEARLRYAMRIAQDFSASVVACYAVRSIVEQMPVDFEAPMTHPTWKLLEELDRQRRNAATAVVERIAAESGCPIQWEEAGAPDPTRALTRRSYLADLVVLGQRDPGRSVPGVPEDLVESVVIDSGTPALVLPYVDAGRSLAERVLVSWKATRSSALALRASLPLLARARAVQLVSWGDDTGPAAIAYLRRHGVEARLDAMPEAPDALGDRLLSRAADFSADLLVMGCYGHSRAREFVLGGVTRSILESMTLPVLMAH